MSLARLATEGRAACISAEIAQKSCGNEHAVSQVDLQLASLLRLDAQPSPLGRIVRHASW